MNTNPLDPEDLESDLQRAFPGLSPHAYQSIAREALHRSTGGEGGREWAMNTAKHSLLEMTRKAGDDDDAIWSR
jgi:hypothetical protein